MMNSKLIRYCLPFVPFRLPLATWFVRVGVLLMPHGVDCRDVTRQAVIDRAFDPTLKALF